MTQFTYLIDGKLMVGGMIEQVVKLAKSEFDSLGFIPQHRYYEAEHKGTIFYQVENGEFVGFLLVGGFPSAGTTHIWQECIDKSARGYGSGKRLVQKLINKCMDKYVYQIVLRCAEDLPSNEFWRACGFILIKTIYPNTKRKRAINIYRLQLIPDLFGGQQVQVSEGTIIKIII